MKVYPLLFILYIAIILQGCVSSVIVGVAAVATKSTMDPRTISTQLADSILKIQVTNALAKDQRLKKEARIVNTVYQGKILLTGQAPTIELVKRAMQIVINISNNTIIYNEIRKGEPVSFGHVAMDTWITMKICSQLLINDKIKSSNIKVITENSEVFLFGVVTNAEGKFAAEVASKVSNVKQVTTAFTYL